MEQLISIAVEVTRADDGTYTYTVVAKSPKFETPKTFNISSNHHLNYALVFRETLEVIERLLMSYGNPERIEESRRLEDVRDMGTGA